MKGQRIGYTRVSSLGQNKERQLEGIVIAEQKGLHKGRKQVLTTEEVVKIMLRIKNGEKKAQIARDIGGKRTNPIWTP